MPSDNNSPRLYTDLASWFHLLSAPDEYAEEADFALATLNEAGAIPAQTVLELGSGGGNNAFHLKRTFDLTLVDLSEQMLALSRSINPECAHVAGDMREVRFGLQFDRVFVHDAVMYLLDERQLKSCMETAFMHCKPGGAALFMPDCVRETFVSSVHHGGHDDEHRGIRFFEWTFDPDEGDSTYTVDFVYLLREGKGPVRVEHDVHLHGLFSTDVWLRLLGEAGFSPSSLVDPYGRVVFVGKRR